jgi:hypothetical protein
MFIYLACRKAGANEMHLLHYIDDPSEVIILFEIEDLQKGKRVSRLKRFT